MGLGPFPVWRSTRNSARRNCFGHQNHSNHNNLRRIGPLAKEVGLLLLKESWYVILLLKRVAGAPVCWFCWISVACCCRGRGWGSGLLGCLSLRLKVAFHGVPPDDVFRGKEPRRVHCALHLVVDGSWCHLPILWLMVLDSCTLAVGLKSLVSTLT